VKLIEISNQVSLLFVKNQNSFEVRNAQYIMQLHVSHKVVDPMNLVVDVVIIIFQLHLKKMQNVPS